MSASVYSVTQINTYIKNMFEEDFALKHIYIRGEISNCKYHTSGHIYFTLKDSGAVLACVMFKMNRAGLSFKLKEGMKVIALGKVSIYERDGKYQFYAKEITPDGTGQLYLRYEQLKSELEEMGMFAPEYKRPIPFYAKKIGIVTASTGAAIRDIINIARRRNPYVKLYLYPALVQGEGAVPSIVRGIETLDQMGMDCLIIGRGGGSLEDLWAFNEEETAYAVFHAKTPIISAVGHETDVTITDFVADLRAPTPSAAAELAVFDYGLFCRELTSYKQTLMQLEKSILSWHKEQVKHYQLQLKMHSPSYELTQKQLLLDEKRNALTKAWEKRMLLYKHQMELMASRLDASSPLKRLSAGYAFVEKEKEPVNSIENIRLDDQIHIYLKDGKLEAKVTKIDIRKKG